MKLIQLVEASTDVASTRGRKKKVERLAAVLRGAEPPVLGRSAQILAGESPAGKVGVGHALAQRVRSAAVPSPSPSLSVTELVTRMEAIKAISGKGSTARREQELGALLSACTDAEQSFVVRLLLGELRQGALEAVVVDAIAVATETDRDAVRRAVMLSGGIARVADAAAHGGDTALGAFELELMRPLQPMLAQPAGDVDEAMAELGETSIELKLDGARVQVHKDGDRIEVFSRKLNRVTAAVPEVVEAVRAMQPSKLVLDGEAIALREDGRPHPFQVTMRRFGRKLDVEAMRSEIPLSVRFFDCLRVDADTVLDAPGRVRNAALVDAVPASLLVPRIVPATAQEADAFLRDAYAHGHEGAMVKSLDAPYEAGKRGKGWRKIKQAHTLDLVVIAAEWGSGRRHGSLSNLHLAARGPDGTFVMLGKTFKGLTDALLAWQTRELLAREVGRDGHIVHVRPELVAEIAFNDVQTSPHYPAGMALRFARVRRYRDDKTAAEADTIETVRGLMPA
ncbi:MAG: ATP-dependent DNA ligase [Nannocystaceae bacterium]|nr:ATP-dependent DNA ligase [bacterium]